MSSPLGLSTGRGEKWPQISNTNHRGKDFTTLYTYSICQSCWGWSKFFAWISGNSWKEKLFPGTFTDLWSCIHLQKLYYEQDNPSLLTVTFLMKSRCVSTLPSLERTVLLPDLFPGKHTVLGAFSDPTVPHSAQEPLSYFPSPAHEVLKGEKLPTSSPSPFRGLSINFPSPFFLFSALRFRWKHLDRRELSLNNNLGCSTFQRLGFY